MARPPGSAKGNGRDILLFGIHGRNGFDPVFMVPETQCLEAYNVEFFRTSLARKRGGSTTVSTTGGTAMNKSVALMRHSPGIDDTSAELWSVDTSRFHRLAGGTAWADIALLYGDLIVAAGLPDCHAVTLNGKFFFAFDCGVNRSYVWDGTTMRRTGLAQPSIAPTVANTGSGSYTATPRSYRQQNQVQVAGVVTRQSELSAAVAFTPSGSGTAARVTKTATMEDETHWAIYGSDGDGVYHLLTTLAIGTTTYDDSADPLAYDGDTPPDDGSYLTPPCARYIVADDGRLIMGGVYTTSGTAVGNTPNTISNRVWWTSAPGSSNISDDERIEIIEDGIQNFSDIEQPITGISHPMHGEFFVFSYNAMWKFAATGDPASPYSRIRVTGGQGCISHKSIVVAEDDSGDPAVYWLSPRGPMRAGRNGVQYIGRDVEDMWRTVNRNITLYTSSLIPKPFGIWYAEKHQIWWYVPVGAGTYPNTKLVFDTQSSRTSDGDGSRHGWSVHVGPSTGVGVALICATIFSNTIGTLMSRDLKPYLGYWPSVSPASDCIVKADTSDLTDWDLSANPHAATAFQAYIDSRPLTPWGLARFGGMADEAILVADVAAGVSIQITLTRDDGAETRTKTVLLTAVSDGGAETIVYPQFSGLALAGASSMRVRLGDAAAVAAAWNLHALVLPTLAEESK